MSSFDDFSLQSTTLTALASMEISEPTPIQSEAIPALLAGHDLVGQSATGSGKTLAYSIPLVERLARDKRVVQALVLVPTRELAVQVNTVLSKLAARRRLATVLLVGGRPYDKQIAALRYGAQIVVGTPGRVKDHIERGSLMLSQVRVCVLDEADQMLDIGFAPIIEEILATTPETRQMTLFSATMPDWVEKLVQKFLKNPVKVEITPEMSGHSTIEQIAYQVPHDQKMAALCTLLQSAEGESTLIFGRTKYGVERLGQQLSKLGFTVGTLHGNKSQHAREEVLTAFRRGRVQTLLATNVAARGLDIQGIYQVINYELPESSELFTHRIGRTGRMGRQGKAITLLVPSDISKWRRMARSLGQTATLQRLTINEAASTVPPAQAVPSVTQEREQYGGSQAARNHQPVSFSQEYEQYREQWPARERKPASPVQKREPRIRPESARDRRPISPAQENEPYREQWPARRRRSVASSEQEYGQYSEPRAAHRRRAFSPDQEYDTFAPPAHESRPTSGPQQRKRTEGVGKASAHSPVWQPKDFYPSGRPSSGQKKRDRKEIDRPASLGKTASKPGTRAFGNVESQHRTARNKSVAAPGARTRRTTEARRSAGR